jgi:hypothetical protein
MPAPLVYNAYVLYITSAGHKPALLVSTPHAGRAKMAAQNASRYDGVERTWVNDFSGNTVAEFVNGDLITPAEGKES